MAKLRGNSEGNDVEASERAGIRTMITRRVDASGRLVLGFALFYAAWLVAAFVVDTVSTSPEISMLAGIAFYFGVVFAVLTVVLGVVLVVMNTISDVRR